MKTKITGHFILYEVIQISTGKHVGEFAIARDEPDHEKKLKRGLKDLAEEISVPVKDLRVSS